MARLPDGFIMICRPHRAKVEIEEKELVMCKHCKHRDPEDLKCDCGNIPWDTQVFPVPDDWYCPYGEKK